MMLCVCCPLSQEIFGSYGKVTSVDLAVDKRVNLPKVGILALQTAVEVPFRWATQARIRMQILALGVKIVDSG